MSVTWAEILRRSGLSLDALAEAIYDADSAGQARHDAPPWLAAGDDQRLRYRHLARVAVDRLSRVEDPLLERLMDAEGMLREQVVLQAKRIAELEKRASP